MKSFYIKGAEIYGIGEDGTINKLGTVKPDGTITANLGLKSKKTVIERIIWILLVVTLSGLLIYKWGDCRKDHERYIEYYQRYLAQQSDNSDYIRQIENLETRCNNYQSEIRQKENKIDNLERQLVSEQLKNLGNTSYYY